MDRIIELGNKIGDPLLLIMCIVEYALCKEFHINFISDSVLCDIMDNYISISNSNNRVDIRNDLVYNNVLDILNENEWIFTSFNIADSSNKLILDDNLNEFVVHYYDIDVYLVVKFYYYDDAPEKYTISDFYFAEPEEVVITRYKKILMS